MKGAGGGVDELGRNEVGADPAHLGVFAWFAVLGLAGPLVCNEDDCEEAVGLLRALARGVRT